MEHSDNIELHASASEATDFYIEEIEAPAASIQMGSSGSGGGGGLS